MRHFHRTNLSGLACGISLGILVFSGCSPKEHETIVATIGPHAISLGEYEAQYLKTLGTREAGAATTPEERQKFLDLLVKYRLKLAGAYGEGLDKKPEVVNEIDAYKGSLASSYLTEREVVAPGMRTLFARRNEEIRASHILISLGLESTPAESAAAYQKAYEFIAQIKAGRDFGQIAAESSADPSAKENRGDIYFFTAGQLVTPFEDAVFKMNPGTVTPDPVRTQFGLHVIKVTARQPSPGEVHASHIMIRFTSQTPTPDDTMKAYARIRAIQDSIHAGVDFADLAMRNSEDPGSGARGGDLGFFSRRRWVQPFDEVAMTLKAGDVSRIVRTIYGYHLIKCFEVRPRKTFEEARQELQPLYQQLRFQEDNARYLEGLKRQVGYFRHDEVTAKLLASLDSTKTTRDSAWWRGVTPALGGTPLFTLRGGGISVDSVIAMIRLRPDLGGISLQRTSFSSALDKIGEQLVFSAKADLLQKDVPEFASLLKEYREGILLYQVEQDNIWNRVTMGDSLLKIYFNANRDKFTWPDRVSFTQVASQRDTLARAVASMLAGGMPLDRLTRNDSTRMAAPSTYRVTFARGSSVLDKSTQKILAGMAAELKRDRAVRLTVVAHPDTLKPGERNLRVAEARVEATRVLLVKRLGVDPSSLSFLTLPEAPPAAADTSVDARTRRESLDFGLTGREPLISGKPETLVLAPSADERARRADSLSIGNWSAPFLSNGTQMIVRLNGREKARQKTFEEAAAELSSAYQEHESKRLESEWLTRLRKEYPVVENRAALKNAFAPDTK
jgi:peptidyl-prolyl cis-trans isomerase SurA